MYKRMKLGEFCDSILELYGECELQDLEEDEEEYPYTMWLFDLYEFIIDHKEDIRNEIHRF